MDIPALNNLVCTHMGVFVQYIIVQYMTGMYVCLHVQLDLYLDCHLKPDQTSTAPY